MKRQARDFSPHLDRYVFALPYVQRRKTLDAGGKTGYGCQILEHTAGPVTLLDRTETYLRKSGIKNTIQCDLEKDFPKEKWGAVVAFEIIEHLENPEFFIKNVADNLEEGGVLVFSVPHMKEDPDHKVLFDEKKIKDLISRHLTILEFYIQDSYGISKIPFSRYPVTYVGVAIKT